jgi:hypothetical protein
MLQWWRHRRDSAISYCERCLSACGAACNSVARRERSRDRMFQKR